MGVISGKAPLVWPSVARFRHEVALGAVRRSSIALPTRSWLVIAMGQCWWVASGREANRSTPFIMAWKLGDRLRSRVRLPAIARAPAIFW